MEDKGSGSETGSKTKQPSSSSSTEKSVTNYKKKNTKPCEICKSTDEDDMIMKCYKPSRWLCEACRNFPGMVEVKPDDEAQDSHETANDSVSSTSSRVDGANEQSSQSEAYTTSLEASSTASINTSPEQKQADSYKQSDTETSATNQPSQSQADTSAEVSTNTSQEQKQSDSNTPYDSESSK